MQIIILNLSTDEKNTVLGFTTKWIEKLSKNFSKIFVITMQEGKYSFNNKVKVFEIKKGKFRIFTFYKLLIKILLQNKISGCFAHMTPLQHNLAFPLFFIFKVKTLLWYEHGKVTNTLKISNLLCNRSVSASLRNLKSNKKHFVTGHGIDTELFYPISKFENKKLFKINYVGRISKIKRIDILLKLMKELDSINEINFSLKIIGDIIDKKSKSYYLSLKNYINSQNLKNKITFQKGLYRKELNKEYNQADLVISTSQTNSLDKVLLEAMACETLILTSNPAFSDVLKNKKVASCYCKSNEISELKNAILYFSRMKFEMRKDISKELRKIVLKNHSLEKTIKKISSHLYEISDN